MHQLRLHHNHRHNHRWLWWSRIDDSSSNDTAPNNACTANQTCIITTESHATNEATI